jgi:hypothetical protein
METNLINELMEHINKQMTDFKLEVAHLIAQASLTNSNTSPINISNPKSTPIASPSFGFTIPVARRSNISPTSGNSNRRASYINRTSTALDKQSPNLASSYTQSIIPHMLCEVGISYLLISIQLDTRHAASPAHSST